MEQEISLNFLKNTIKNIEELKELEFTSFDDALDCMKDTEPNGLNADVYNINREEKYFDFTWYDITGTISYNEDTKTYMLCQGCVLEVFYDDYVEPVLRIEV